MQNINNYKTYFIISLFINLILILGFIGVIGFIKEANENPQKCVSLQLFSLKYQTPSCVPDKI